MSRQQRLRLGRLALVGFLMEATYLLFFLRPFPLRRYVATPHLDLGKLTVRNSVSRVVKWWAC